MRAGIWHPVVGAMLLGLLAFATVSRRVVAQTSCEEFDAANITGLTNREINDLTAIQEKIFFCADQEFFQGINVAMTAVGIIASIRFTCTDGEESPWLGRSLEDILYHIWSFDVGMTSINTQELVYDDYVYRGKLQVNGIELTPENELNATSWKPPPGTFENATLDETVTSTDCRGTGLEAFATGVTVWASTNDVRGIRFICAEVTPKCLPRRYPYTLTPAPSASLSASPAESAPTPPASAQSRTDDEERWFDAAWEVAVTVIGACATGVLALLLRTCCHRGRFERCKREAPVETFSPRVLRRDAPPVTQVPADYYT